MDVERPAGTFGRTPLTDLRSLGMSTSFHAIMILIASFAALSLTLPAGPPPPKILHAELGPVDNRAPAENGGGATGDVGGMGVVETRRITAQSSSANGKPARDASADRLIADVLPATPPEVVEPTPTGPMTGVGLLPGEGLGGGGGSGGGSGGGIGRGVGPGTEFFGARERAGSFAYVIDCSGSMTNRGALSLAKKELLASLDQLPPDARVGLVFYNIHQAVLADDRGQLMPATIENKTRIRTRLADIHPDGGTDHVSAMLAAFKLKPEVVFFLTDADKMADSDIEKIRAAGGSTRIQAIEFGDGPELKTADPLRRLAISSGGGFRHVDLSAQGHPR